MSEKGQKDGMSIAVVHDYFNQGGGADEVAEELYCMIPGATLVTTVAVAERLPRKLQGVPIRTSWMQRLPFMLKWYRLYFLLYPLAVETLDMSDYDLIISSSSGYAKGVRARPGAVYVCYCHNPMRWAWEYDGYVAHDRSLSVVRPIVALAMTLLRRWDLAAARRPHHYITNSRYSADRIRKHYGRECTVIPPPIDTDRFRMVDATGDYYLILARLVPYRRIDTAIAACTRLGRQLVIIGAGPDLARLKEVAGPSVRFLGRVSDAEVTDRLAHCRALLFPGVEDFGMVPVEAAACGRPTIAYRAGGSLETIIEGETGLFYDAQTADAVAEAILRFEERDWDRHAIRRHAERFSQDVFRERIAAYLDGIGIAPTFIAPPLIR